MATLQELLQTEKLQIEQEQLYNMLVGLDPGQAYSSLFPQQEIVSPAYPNPLPWTLANRGYKANEIAYACIDMNMTTISEPDIKVYDKKTDKIIKDHEIEAFFNEPCPDMTEMDFWNATVMYSDIAGFIAWEKEFTNSGKLLHVWPMMPQYCSFKRGEGQLLRTIQYQPNTGLPAYNVQRENVLLFMMQDPHYFGLRPFSPTAVIYDILGVDNDMTTMLQTFIRNGAFVSGLLTTEQVINEADATFAKERFRESHGGPNNAGDVVVTGKGMKFQPTNQTFREMVFPEVDARTEARICMAYGMKPILISAKIGLDRSTFSNYEQARAAWYEEKIYNRWTWYAQRVTRDLLPHFDGNPDHECRFDIRDVLALEKRRRDREEGIIGKAKANIITRDESRVELGLEPIDNEPVFIGITTQQQLSEVEQVYKVGGGTSDDLTRVGEKDLEQRQRTANAEERLKLDKRKIDLAEQQADEEKSFRAFAKRRIKEDKPHDIPEFEFKHTDEKRQRKLLSEFGVPDPDAEMVLKALLEVAKNADNA